MIVSLIVLVPISFAAGIIAAVAGGGAFLTFPALMLTGLDARAANIASTLAMYPMQVSTGFSGRKTAAGTPHLSFKSLLLISLIGGIIGALLLLMTPATSFARLVPWLLLASTITFAWSSFRKTPPLESTQRKPDRLGKIGAGIAQFIISVYGGYFGGGIGLLMLTTLTYAGMNIRSAINTKNILAAVMNTSAVGIFMMLTNVPWLRISLVAVAATAGGLVGVQMINRIDEKKLRLGITVIGAIVTIVLFARG